MKAIDLTQKLSKYKTGWIALDRNNDVVEQAYSFKSLSKKVKSKKNEVVLMPASDNYFGYVTNNG